MIKVFWTTSQDIVLSIIRDGQMTPVKMQNVPTISPSPHIQLQTVPSLSKEKHISNKFVKTGDIVIHKKWNTGQVAIVKEDRIFVKFGKDLKMFMIPDAFDKGYLQRL